MLNDHALNNIRHILAAVDGGFQLLVNLFPLENKQRVAVVVEEFGHGGVIDIIAFIL